MNIFLPQQSWTALFPAAFAVMALWAPTVNVSGQADDFYLTGFEQRIGDFGNEGDAVGDGWQVRRGESRLVSGDAFSGERALVLFAGGPSAVVARDFRRLSKTDVAFFDFFWKGAADSLPENPEQAQIAGAGFALALVKENPGSAWFYAANPEGSGWRRISGSRISLDGDFGMEVFVRLTFRLDFAGGAWDLHLDGRPVAANLPMSGRGKRPLPRILLRGHSAKDVLVDDFYAGTENPLFDSADGIDHAWKEKFGLQDGIHSRDDDPDSDGLSVVEEYVSGTHPLRADTSRDGILDGDALARGIDPLAPSNTFPARLPFLEDFERWPLGDIAARGGWRLQGNGMVEVRSEASLGGNRGLLLLAENGGMTARVAVEGEGHSVLWTDYYVRPEPHTAAKPPRISGKSAVALYFDRFGRAVVWDGKAGQWKTIESRKEPKENPKGRFAKRGDAFDWVRVTVRQDFASQTWSLWIDSRNVADNLGFASEQTSYTQFALSQLKGSGSLDHVYIGAREPAGLDIRQPADPPGEEHRIGPPGHASAGLRDSVRGGFGSLRDTSEDGIADADALERGLDPKTPVNSFAVELPFFEDFEERPLGNIRARGGWRVKGGRAEVEAEAALDGNRGLGLRPEDGGLEAAIETQSEGVPVLWTDFHLRPARHLSPEPPALKKGTAVGLYFDRSGNAVAWDGLTGEWRTFGLPALTSRFELGADAFPAKGGPRSLPQLRVMPPDAKKRVAEITRNGLLPDWVRVTIRQDFKAQTWSLWLDSVKVAGGLGFAFPQNEYRTFQLSGVARAAHLDEIYVGEEEPAGLDDDADGLSNIVESSLGTDPENPDTSTDGMWDAEQAFWGFYPDQNGSFITPDSGGGGKVAERQRSNPGNGNAWFIGAGNAKRIWMSARLRGSPGGLPDVADLEGPRTALIAVNHAGYIVGYDGATNAWLNSRYRIKDNSEAVDLDIFLDYETGKWSLCIDNVLCLRDLGFRDRGVRTLTRLAAADAGPGNGTGRGRGGPGTRLEAVTVSLEEPPNLDFSGDGLTNDEKRALGLDIYKVDTNDDGLPDWWMLEHGLDPLDRDLAETDLHGYGLTVEEAFLLGTDPHVEDSDGDGWGDFDEYLAGTDLFDPKAFPVSAGFPDWEMVQIGHHTVPEARSYIVGDEYRIAAAGSAAVGEHDGIAFAYRELTGNFDVTAKVRQPENLSLATAAERGFPAQAGLMVRTSLDEAAPYNAVFSGKFDYWSRFRGSHGLKASDLKHQPVEDDGSKFIRLRRTGNRLRHYLSEDGEHWTLVSEMSIAMPETVYAGLFASSHSNDFRIRARMSDVEVVQLSGEADWYLDDEDDTLSAFDSFAWMGEWDGTGDHSSAILGLRSPSLEELRKVGMQVSSVDAISGSQAVATIGEWTAVAGGGILCMDRRGWIGFDLEVQSPDIYLIQIEGREGNEKASLQSAFTLKLYLEDEYLGTRVLEASLNESGEALAFTPWLTEGTHRLRILWDGSHSYTHLQLDAVRLMRIDGADADGNGVKDWAQERLVRQTGGTVPVGDLSFVVASDDMDETIETRIHSYVSPLPLEGVDRYHSLMKIERKVLPMAGAVHRRGEEGFDLSGDRAPLAGPTIFPVESGPGHRYRADIPLVAGATNAITISWQNGVAEERRLVEWIPYNVLSGGDLALRVNDTLLLTAGNPGQEDGSAIIVVNGERFETAPGAPIEYTFEEPGEYTIEGIYRDLKGPDIKGAVQVTVRDFSFPDRPLAYVNRVRDWTAAAEADWIPAFEADPRLVMETPESESGTTLRFHPDDNDLKTIVARLGENGPILDSTNVEGVRLFSSWETYVKVVEILPDESRVVEMMTILSPVPEDVELRLKIFVGGILFDDGTLERVVRPEDFDELGQVTMRFIMPKDAVTSVCHRTYLYQNDELIGVR